MNTLERINKLAGFANITDVNVNSGVYIVQLLAGEKPTPAVYDHKTISAYIKNLGYLEGFFSMRKDEKFSREIYGLMQELMEFHKSLRRIESSADLIYRKLKDNYSDELYL
jgi:hypothetical protein